MFLERTARQGHGLHPPKRPDYGTVGRPIKLRANFFPLRISSKLTDLYHYDIEITPNKCPKAVKRDVVREIVRQYKDSTFKGHAPAFDGEKNLYSRIKLPVGNGEGAVSEINTISNHCFTFVQLIICHFCIEKIKDCGYCVSFLSEISGVSHKGGVCRIRSKTSQSWLPDSQMKWSCN